MWVRSLAQVGISFFPIGTSSDLADHECEGVISGVMFQDTSTSGVPSSTYIAFIYLVVFGLFVAGLLIDPGKTKRSNDTPIASFESLPWHQELRMLAKTSVEPMMTLTHPTMLS